MSSPAIPDARERRPAAVAPLVCGAFRDAPGGALRGIFLHGGIPPTQAFQRPSPPDTGGPASRTAFHPRGVRDLPRNSPGGPSRTAVSRARPSGRTPSPPRRTSRAPPGGAPPPRLAAASAASGTTWDNYRHQRHLGDLLRVDFPPKVLSPLRRLNAAGTAVEWRRWRSNSTHESAGFSTTRAWRRRRSACWPVGDPNLLRQIERGPLAGRSGRRTGSRRSSTTTSGSRAGAEAPPARQRGRRPARWARRTPRSEAMREQPSDRRTNPPVRLLRIREVQARTGLSRSTIYARGRPTGAFPRRSGWAAVRVARWVRGTRWTTGSGKWVEEAPGRRGPTAAARN